MSKEIKATTRLKKRLSGVEDQEIFIQNQDSFSEDGKYGEYVKKQNREILKKIKELLHDGQSTTNQQEEQSFVMANDNHKQEFLEDLEEEYGQVYQESKVKINTYVKLIPKNELQLSYIYHDKYPFLSIRKKILIQTKLVSFYAQLITTHPIFEVITLIMIVFNSVMLAIDDPTTNIQTSFQNLTDLIFLAYYTAEAILKIVAQGFIFPKKSYLRDTWNILDFSVIITAYIPYFLASNSVNLNALRSFRVLRPLRTVSSIKALRTILLALFASIAQLRDAAVVLMFFYSIFAIAGVQLFSGYLKRRCIGEESGITWISDELLFCADDNNCPFPEQTIYNENFICGKQIANPQNNLINFDTFGYAFLQVFIITTLEGWTQIQTAVMLTFSQFVVLYFIIVVLVGAFFLVNLTLAIIKLNFKPEKIQEELEQIKEEIEEYDYKQLRQLKLYIPERERVDTTGFGITWDRSNDLDQNIIMNCHKHPRKGASQINVIKDTYQRRLKGKNKVHFQPIKSAIYYSHPVMLNKKYIKIEGIYGMGNQNKLNLQQQQQQITSNQQSNITAKRSSGVRKRNSQSSNNDDQTSSKQMFDNESASANKQTKKSLQLCDQQLSSEFMNSPMMDLQSENIRPLNGGTMLIQRRASIESSKSGESKLERTPINNKLQIPKIGEIKQQSQNIKANQKFSLASAMKYQKQPRNSPKPDSQKSIDDHEFDSVNLSELNSLSDDELDQRLEEMDIEIEEKITNVNSLNQKQIQKELNRQRKMENRRFRDLNKNTQLNLDEASLKLKSKLFNTKFYPIIVVNAEFNSINDILISQMLQKLEQKRLEQEKKIMELDIKITYCFKNSKQSLELKKTSNGKTKSITKSGYFKSGNKSKKTNLSLRRVQPIIDEIHPFEDIQMPIDKNGEILEEQNQDNQNGNSESEEENEINIDKDQNNINGSGNQKINQKKRKKKEEKNQKLDYEQLAEKFNDSSDCIVDLTKIRQVELNKQFDQEELALLPPLEIDQQKSVFYQEFVDIKQKDIHVNKGTITAQASIEDVLLIADYTFYDQKFAKQMNSVMKALNYSKRETFIYLKGFIGLLLVFQNQLLYFVQSEYFEASMNLAVALNTVILALDGLLPDSTLTITNQFNFGFTILFTIELGLKILGMGPRKYLRDTMNIFDAVIVALSLVELFFLGGSTNGKSSLSAFRSVRIFRAFRVLRVTKLMRSLQFMGFLIKVLSNAFQSFMYIMILLILFIFIFTLLGMAFFGGQLSKTPSRQSYDDIQSAFLVVFQVLTLENWNSILWDLLVQDVSAFITIPYLVFWIMIGNYVFLNLFLAILLENFEEEYKNDKAGLDTNIEIGKDSVMDNTTQAVNSTSTLKSTMKTKKHTFAQQLENNEDNHDQKKHKQINQAFQYFIEIGICQYSLYLFSQQNIVRKICYRIVKDDKFETLIFSMIFLTSTKLVFDTYISDTGQLKQISLDIDIFFAVFFGVEMCMKIIAFGLIQQESSYLRESWNVLDFFIVIASFIDVSVSTINLSFVKILRLLRTLRPLRFITHNRSMKILVSALLQSINGIFNVAIVVILVWMMFAILGINLEKNKMSFCNMGDDELYYHYGVQECKENGGVWENRKTNFDNILNGMLTLFILSTLEGWPDIMYWFIDADESGPIKNAQLQFSWYFIVFILFGSILLMNLFIGVILVNYHLAEEASRDKILTQAQVDWIELQKLIVHSSPNLAMFFSPENPFRAKIFSIIKHRYFDPTILMIIVLNIIIMGLSQDDAPILYDSILTQFNTAFTFVFIGEAILKIIALGPIGYMRNSWNRFDFFVVCASILDLILSFTGNSFITFLSAGPQLARVFRVLRVTRLFRLIKSFEGLQKLIETAIYSLPAMLNVTALLFLVFFIFSILGVFLFGTIKSGWVIDDTNNFQDFHHSIELLFRCATGEDWYKVMFDTMQDGQGYYCIFFIIFIVIQQYIMLNLFILIILDQYEINYFNSDNPLNKFQEYENMFIESWSKFAKEDKGMKMHQQLLVPLMLQMEKPIGYDLKQKLQNEITEWKRINPQLDNKENIQKYTLYLKAQAKRSVSTQLMKMNIYSDNNGHVKYHQILFCVMKSYMWKKVQINLSLEGAEKILQKEDETQKRLKKKYLVQSKEVSLVNPIVEFLFVHMAYKTLKRYGEKKRQQKELQVLLEQEQEHYSDGFSSDSSFDNKIEIISRNSNDTEHPKRPDYGKPKFISLPNTQIYKDDVFINQEVLLQNDSNISSDEEEEDQNEDVMKQYTRDFQKHLIHNGGSNGNIQDDKSGGAATKSSQSRQSQINKQQKKQTLKPNDIIQGFSKKSIQSISQTNNITAIHDNQLQ